MLADFFSSSIFGVEIVASSLSLSISSSTSSTSDPSDSDEDGMETTSSCNGGPSLTADAFTDSATLG